MITTQEEPDDSSSGLESENANSEEELSSHCMTVNSDSTATRSYQVPYLENE